MRPIDVYSSCLAEPVCDMRAHLPYLQKIACGNILEIGVRGGASTSAFLLGLEEHGGHLWSVDIDPSCGSKFAHHPQWTFIHGNSLKWDRVKQQISPRGLPVDILFIDGDHSLGGVLADLENYWEWLRPGGTILMHDVNEPMLPEVRMAMNQFLAGKDWKHEIRAESHGLAVIEVPGVRVNA